MNFKPADRKASPRSVQKLQDFDGVLEGTLIEVSQSKMGSPIYRIQRDFDLVSIYGFKDLDEQMRFIKSGALIRIVYLGSEPTYSGKIRHLAKVDVGDEAVENSVVESRDSIAESKPDTTAGSCEIPIPVPQYIDGPTSSEAYNRFLHKLGIVKLPV